jgi:hypothetical protein
MLLGAAATLRAFGDSAAEALRMSRRRGKWVGRNNRKQQEADFDNAMKRFLVRADVVIARKRRAAVTPILVIRANYVGQITN